jgi:outer membrane protein assembly factor BamE (lipoprotein component of BamABCDE complex)
VKERFLALLLAALLAAQGCVSGGTKEITDPAKTSQIQIGKSTRADVKTLLGEPAKVNFTDNNEEVWEYAHVSATPRAATFIPIVSIFADDADAKGDILTIRFDKNGVVKNMRQGKTTFSGGSVLD